MKIEKLRAKLAKYEALYREAKAQMREVLDAEIDALEGLKIERRVHKSKGGKRGPKAKSARSAGVGRSSASSIVTTKRRPGRPKMTEAQKAAAREMRRQKLATVSNEGAMVAMDDRPPITNWDRSAEAEARGHA